MKLPEGVRKSLLKASPKLPKQPPRSFLREEWDGGPLPSPEGRETYKGRPEDAQRTLRGRAEALRGRSEGAQRTLRGRPEDAQRTLRGAQDRSEDVQRTLRGRSEALRGRSENVQRRSEDAPRTRRERSEDAQRTRRGRAEDAQRCSEAAQRMFRGRSEARSGVNSKRTSNQQHGSAADTGPAWQSVHPHTLQWSSHLPARVKICAFEPVIAQKVRTHLNLSLIHI